jgi:hypothetical protein
MRSHGQPAFPDPNLDGSFSNIPDEYTSQFITSQKTCQHLLPNGGVPTAAQIEKVITASLEFAQCMRTHGILNFPTPKPVDLDGHLGFVFGLKGIDRNSPQYQKALRYCEAH